MFNIEEEDGENEYIRPRVFPRRIRFGDLLNRLIRRRNERISGNSVGNELNKLKVKNIEKIKFIKNLLIENQVNEKFSYSIFAADNENQNLICSLQFLLPGKRDIIGNTQIGHKKRLNYFEVKVLELDNEDEEGNALGIGLAKFGSCLTQIDFVGWRNDSCGYHSDNGGIYNNFGAIKYEDKSYLQEKYHKSDVVGCGFNLESEEIFFTKNGKKFKKICYRDFKKLKLIPTITIVKKFPENKVKFALNRGSDTVVYPFMYSELNVKKMYCKNKKKYFDLKIICCDGDDLL